MIRGLCRSRWNMLKAVFWPACFGRYILSCIIACFSCILLALTVGQKDVWTHMESVTFKQGFKSGGPGFASAEINEAIPLGTVIRGSIDQTYESHGGFSLRDRVVRHQAIMPTSGLGEDGIRHNVIRLARESGRADALLMIEMGRLDQLQRNSLHDLRETTQDATRRAKDYVAESSKQLSSDLKGHANTRVRELRESIQESVAATNRNIEVVNRMPDLVGQTREAIHAVLNGHQAPTQRSAVHALQELADSSTELSQFGEELRDVPSRLERIAYVSGRNSALAIAGVKNLETDVLEMNARLAAASVQMGETLNAKMEHFSSQSSRLLRHANADQDEETSKIFKEMSKQSQSMHALEKTLSGIRSALGNYSYY